MILERVQVGGTACSWSNVATVYYNDLRGELSFHGWLFFLYIEAHGLVPVIRGVIQFIENYKLSGHPEFLQYFSSLGDCSKAAIYLLFE